MSAPTGIDKAIIVGRSMTNAVRITIAGGADEVEPDVIEETATALIDIELALYERYGAGGTDKGAGGSGNARSKSTSKRSSGGSKKRGSGRQSSGNRGRGGGGFKSGPSEKQVKFYGDILDAIYDENDGFDMPGEDLPATIEDFEALTDKDDIQDAFDRSIEIRDELQG